MSENTTNFLFSGKVYCGLCNWKYRAKKERNKNVYICSKYSTGKDGGCERHKVDEQHLALLIENQFKIYVLPFDRFDLIQAIVITRENITIYYNRYAPTRQMQNTVSFGTVGQQPEEYEFGRREA
jgi:hypothetical protein